MKKTFITVLLFLSIGCFAQGEANIWYFGFYAGLDFNSGSPVALTDSQLQTNEGCATISNSAGKLLFYTDGVKIWDKNHNLMPNGTGLLGHPSSTQSAVVVPKPNSNTIYYVFATLNAANGGITYSEVDMSLNGGLGDVTNNKNIPLVTPACEKITAIKKINSDYWVMVHGFGDNNFYAYTVSGSGVNPTPVVSSAGATITSNFNTIGYLKFSPDGTKIVAANLESNIELFDFDIVSGLVSNSRVLLTNYGNYGVEFSPSGNVLYVTSNIHLYQYDLTATNIFSTRTLIYDANNELGALQLGPDGKIYLAKFYSNYLHAIAKPEILGVGCDFTFNAVSLGPFGLSEIGLPQFIQSYFNTSFKVQNLCLGSTTMFSLNTSSPPTSIAWDFGDGTTSSDENPSHLYTSPGTYTVSVTATGATGTGTKTRDVVISPIPTATPPQNVLVCDDNNDGFYNFDLTTHNTAILNGQDPNLYTIKYYANTTDYSNNIAIGAPKSYKNPVAYQQETIIAEVSTTENGNCKSATSFNIDVFDAPKLNTAITKLKVCDNTSVGTDADGRVVFDLTQRATEILNAQSAMQFTLSYYKDGALTQSITNPTMYQNTNTTETIFVKKENKDNVNCFVMSSFQIEVLALPSITKIVDLKQCDDDIDGFSVFNLEEAIKKITPNASLETITFFRTAVEAQNNTNPILNTTSYTNQIVSSDQVYVRVLNNNNCSSIAQLNLIVSTTQIPLNFTRTFTQCDDTITGTNSDGIASFDFSSVTNDVQAIFPPGQVLDITYYNNLADALSEKNTIIDITNYRNIGYPNSQNIYVRVDSRLNNDCLGLGSYISLNVEAIPIIKPITETHCDDDQDGLYAFDTSLIRTKLLTGLTNVTLAYFDQNNNALSSPLPNPFVTASQTLKVVATNNTITACSYTSTVKFVVDVLPRAFPVATSLTTVCDDELDPSKQDGKFAFNTSSFETTILGGQTGMIVKYFDENNNSLPSPLPNPFVTATQNVIVEVSNPINTTCAATVTLPFVVNPIPKIILTGDELVCSNLPSFTKVLDAGLLDGSPTSNYSYLWSLNGIEIKGETSYTLTVNTEGLFAVKVTNAQGCSRTRTFTVKASDKANITGVEIVDLAESNSISINLTGAGNYVYSLDDEYGHYQKEALFNNVPAGIHTVFVKDLNGCGIVPKEVAIIGIPVFFTPNNDGYNDYWNIKGANTDFNSKTRIYIFDRYGKLINQISPLEQGWDGTFNGQQLPSTDYWYSIQLEDGRILKGHFTLKR